MPDRTHYKLLDHLLTKSPRERVGDVMDYQAARRWAWWLLNNPWWLGEHPPEEPPIAPG